MSPAEPTSAATTDRPTGVVTFLFTDIEGSSRLEQRVGTAAYAALRERHRVLFRGAFAAHGGIEQGTSGDSFFVVFPSADGAVRAAVEGQRALAAEPWPDDGAIRVRIGIHSGQAVFSDRDYVGIDINRAARIEAAAHGGQIVVSDTTRALAAGSLAGGDTAETIGFLDLGLNRLKDFEPIQLHQVTAQGLGRDFPPLRALDARFINLQPPVTSFVGRRREIDEVVALLATSRILTLTGPGGTGKTRLNIAAAQKALSTFPAGAAWVPLGAVTDPNLVPTSIAAVLGLVDEGTRDLVDALAERIGADRLLLVLDNFEQVVAAASVVGRLIARCPGLTVLVSSREVLRLAGEREYPVQPLTVPDPGAAADPEAMADSESIALFVERAREVRPDFHLSPENAAAVATIVARLDGLPLAIELAAARIRILPPSALAARLEQSLGILAGGARDLPERQQTLRGAIAWSYDLLDPREKAFFRRLSAFSGGWSLDAVGPVGDPSAELGIDPLDGLGSLVEKSLVRQADGTGDEPRFRMLQTIREFGLEQLGAAEESAAVRDRHLTVFAGLAAEAETEIVGKDTRRWLDRLADEHDNIRSALRWAMESDQLETGLTMAGKLWRFWHQRGHLGEGLGITNALLACPAAAAHTAGRAKALNGAGGLAYWQNDFAAAGRYYAEQLEIVQELRDLPGLAEANYNLGFLEAVPGHFEVALERYQTALELFRTLGDDSGVVSVLVGLGMVEYLTGNLERAAEVGAESNALSRRLGDHYRLASSLGIQARVALDRGLADDAFAYASEALRLFADVADPTGMEMSIDDLGLIAYREGDMTLGLRLGGAAAALRDRTAGGAPPSLVKRGDFLDEARERMGPGEADANWAVGHAMTVDAAVAAALVRSSLARARPQESR
ncbi:MAG TPA: tetratricopeptide repeat protein [Candidatus Acidoferrum sp.]|nr:tetratricopeptide repeat protein [Candidatus Acidoferrum sp.]